METHSLGEMTREKEMASSLTDSKENEQVESARE